MHDRICSREMERLTFTAPAAVLDMNYKIWIQNLLREMETIGSSKVTDWIALVLGELQTWVIDPVSKNELLKTMPNSTSGIYTHRHACAPARRKPSNKSTSDVPFGIYLKILIPDKAQLKCIWIYGGSVGISGNSVEPKSTYFIQNLAVQAEESDTKIFFW